MKNDIRESTQGPSKNRLMDLITHYLKVNLLLSLT